MHFFEFPEELETKNNRLRRAVSDFLKERARLAA